MMGMIKTIFGLFSSDSTVVRLGMYITLLGMLGGGVAWTCNSIYEAGFSKAEVKYLKANKEAQDEADRLWKLKLDELESELTKISKTAKRDAQKLAEIQNVAPTIKEVVKVVEKSECKNLHSEYIDLLNTTLKGFDN